MPLPGSDKYRVTPADRHNGESLMERANAATSTLAMLLGLGCTIPEGVERSWKFHCPWGHEHGDGGKDKAARYYAATDTAFCFAQHGALTPVKMVAYDQGISNDKAAEQILRDAGLWNVNKDWRERFAELKSQRAETHTNMTYAVDALHVALREDDRYRYRQYDEDVRRKMEQCLEVLDRLPDHSLDSLRKWLKAAKTAILKVVYKS